MSDLTKPVKEPNKYAQGCALSIVIFVGVSIVFGAGLLTGWLAWG